MIRFLNVRFPIKVATFMPVPLIYSRGTSASSDQQSEPCSIMVAHKSTSLDLKLQEEPHYNLCLDHCSLKQGAIDEMESLLMNYNIQELSFLHQGPNEDLVSQVLILACMSNLRCLRLIGFPLSQSHLSLLKEKLPSSSLRNIQITVDSNAKIQELEALCRELALQVAITTISVIRSSKSDVSKKNLKSSICSNTIYGQCDKSIQGGFNDYEIINSRTSFNAMLEQLKKGFNFTIIRNWNGKEKHQDSEILYIFFTVANERGYIIDFNKPFSNYAICTIRGRIKDILENPTIEKTCRNYRRYFNMLTQYGIELKGVEFDVRSALKLLYPYAKLYHFSGIKALFKSNKLAQEDVESDGINPLLIKYAARDYRLRLTLTRLLKQRRDYGYYKTIVLPLEKLLVEIERRGYYLNLDIVDKKIDHLNREIAATQQNLLLLSIGDYEKERELLSEERTILENRLASLIHIKKHYDNTSQIFYPSFKDLFGFKKISSLKNLNSHFFRDSILFESLINKKFNLISIRFPTLPFIFLAQLSQESKLIDINKKSNDLFDFHKKVNKYVFRNSDYINKTTLLNEFSIGRCPASKLEVLLTNETSHLLTCFEEAFANVQAFHKKISQKEQKKPYIETLFGGKKSFKDFKNNSSRIHYSIMGSAHNYIIMFATQLSEIFKSKKLSAYVHSIHALEVLVHVHDKELIQVLDLIREVNASILNWGQAIVYQLGHWPNVQEYEDRIWQKHTSLQAVALAYQQNWEKAPLSESTRHHELLNCLQHHFGIEKLKPLQEQIIINILNNHDTIGLLPTGYGKSICFQLPAMMRHGVTIVISPLISLIENQIYELHQRGIFALWLKSFDIDKLENYIDRFKLIYVTPETFSKSSLHQLLLKFAEKINLFVIDEVHCISMWGKTFRPSYRELGCIKKNFLNVPILALTASATFDITQDITTILDLQKPKLIVGSYIKKNISIQMQTRNDLNSQLLTFLEKHPGEPGIIYCGTKCEVNKIYQYLHSKGYLVKQYHAGLSSTERTDTLEQFLLDQCQLVIATVAFGMGINKLNIRFIFHTMMPSSIERYYQEIGRMGRDNLPAKSVVLYAHEDFIFNCSLSTDIKNESTKNEVIYKANQMYALCLSLSACRQKIITNYFNDFSVEACNNCDICRHEIAYVNGTEIVKKVIESVLSCNQSSSLNYIARILCNVEHVSQQLKHAHISSLGCLSEFKLNEVKALIVNLVYLGYLSINNSEVSNNVLLVNEKSISVLKGEELIMIHRMQTTQYSYFPKENNDTSLFLLMACSVVMCFLVCSLSVLAALRNEDVTVCSVPTSRGLSAGSNDAATLMDSADKSRNVTDEGSEQLHEDNMLCYGKRFWFFSSDAEITPSLHIAKVVGKSS